MEYFERTSKQKQYKTQNSHMTSQIKQLAVLILIGSLCMNTPINMVNRRDMENEGEPPSWHLMQFLKAGLLPGSALNSCSSAQLAWLETVPPLGGPWANCCLNHGWDRSSYFGAEQALPTLRPWASPAALLVLGGHSVLHLGSPTHAAHHPQPRVSWLKVSMETGWSKQTLELKRA